MATPISDGTEVVFRSPVDCSQVTGLVVYYNGGNKEFAFADAHGNNVGDIDHLFAENVVVKVILDVTHAMAFVQNADTNAYIERTFIKTVNGVKPDESGNVVVQGGGGGSGEAGADGFSPVANVTQTASGAVISITDKSGTTTATIVNGKDGADGKDGKDGAQGIQGEQGPKGDTGAPGADGAKGDKGDKGDTGAQGNPGKDGVSATHSWNGTTLTITSASGTSSANLKGEKGDKGDQGIQGIQGIQGEKGDTGAPGSNGTNGKDGANGTSVTVKSVSESTADGGSNVVTFSDGKTVTIKNGSKGSTGATGPQGPAGKDGAADLSVEILLPSEIVAVVGVEFNMYYKSFIRANRSLDNFEIKCSLSNTSVDYKLYNECFRLTAVDANVGSYTLTVQVKDIISGSVKAEKAVAFHIIKNRALNNKNVLYLGDSLTFSRGGLYPAEIQYNLSGGKLISIGSQIGSAESNGIGQVRHEGYNGATVGGFLSANVTSGNVNKFYNPSTGQFDLAYFMTNQGYTQLDAVCLNLGHNNLGNHVNAVSGLQTIISKIHEYNADIPVIISLIEPLAGQDGWTAKTKSTAIEMNRHWKNLISAYIAAFDNGKISNVYLSAPYLNIDADNDFPTETVARSARDTTQIVRQNDAMHPGKIGTLKMADVYFANLLYRIPEDNAIYYSITKNLTNVTTNNNVGSIKEGSAYSATLTPADGYVLDSVTVTMGGNPVTVTNGVINISGVTGDIVITATAKVYVPAYTNLAKPSTASSSPNTALTADEWLNGYYISSKKISAKADLVVTNKIPLTFNDTIRIKGFATTGNIGGSSCQSRFRVLPCDASGAALQSEIYPAIANATQGTGRLDIMDVAELENGVYCFSFSQDTISGAISKNVAFVRICGYPIDGNNANVIVTVNEEITD